MKQGKVSQTIVNRSIFKPFHIKKNAMLPKPSTFEPCAVLGQGEKEILLSTVSRYGKKETVGVYALAEALGHLIVKGARAKGILISLFLPEWFEEETLKNMTMQMARAAEEAKVILLGAKAEVLPGLSLIHI